MEENDASKENSLTVCWQFYCGRRDKTWEKRSLSHVSKSFNDLYLSNHCFVTIPDLLEGWFYSWGWRIEPWTSQLWCVRIFDSKRVSVINGDSIGSIWRQQKQSRVQTPAWRCSTFSLHQCFFWGQLTQNAAGRSSRPVVAACVFDGSHSCISYLLLWNEFFQSKNHEPKTRTKKYSQFFNVIPVSAWPL